MLTNKIQFQRGLSLHSFNTYTEHLYNMIAFDSKVSLLSFMANKIVLSSTVNSTSKVVAQYALWLRLL